MGKVSKHHTKYNPKSLCINLCMVMGLTVAATFTACSSPNTSAQATNQNQILHFFSLVSIQFECQFYHNLLIVLVILQILSIQYSTGQQLLQQPLLCTFY